MEKIVKKTGDFGIGRMIHVVHMTDDVPTMNRFYEDVFGALVYFGMDEPNYLPVEDRWASLLVVADLCVEPMAPNVPVQVEKPVGKFYTRFGRHLHSVGYRVDDLVGLGNRLIKEGVHIGKPGGGKLEEVPPEMPYFYPSPRDMQGLMVEMCNHDMFDDPRQRDSWSSQVKMWQQGHPLGIQRLAYVTLGVKDLDAAVETYVDKVQAVPVSEATDESDGSRYALVQLGDSLLKLAQPVESESPLGRHVAQWGNMIYGITVRVRDLDEAEQWLAKKRIRTSRPRDGILAADPDDCFGAPYFFSTETISNDPFAD